MDFPHPVEPKLREDEILSNHPIPVCLCGAELYLHNIEKKVPDRPHVGCKGFTLHHYRWRVTRYVETMP